MIGNDVLEGENLANSINESFVAVNKTMPPIQNLTNYTLKPQVSTTFQLN